MLGNCIIIFCWSSEDIGICREEPGGSTGWDVLKPLFFKSGAGLFFPTMVSEGFDFPLTPFCFAEMAFVKSTS